MNQQKQTYEQLLDELQQKEIAIQQLEAEMATQQAQIEELQYQSQLLDFVLDAVISSDRDFNLVTWNKAAESMYGWTAEEVLGRNARELLRTQYIDEDNAREAHQQYKQKGLWRGRMIHHRKDGSPIPVRATTSMIKDNDGKIVGSVAVLRDISQELEAEQSLHNSREFYQVISEIMSDYAYLYDVYEDGTWKRVWTTRGTFLEITGYNRDEVKDTYGLYHPDEVERVQRDVERTLAGEDTEGEYRIVTKGGDIKWIQIRRRAIWDDTHQRVIGFYGAGKDITNRRLAEEQLKHYNLEQERVAVLRNFIQDASHDLKTPLSTINTSLYILRRLATNDKQLAHIEKLEFHINRFNRLIENMFEMSRLDLLTDVPLVSINLNAYLRDVINIRREKAKQSQIEILDRLDNEALYILGDATLLLKAINNIMDNAIEHTPADGTITISRAIEDGWVVLSIQDTGVGIPAEELSNIFRRFYRGDKARGSNTMSATGLGLSIADKIMKLHNGHIVVTSNVGHGSCFDIYLPQPD